jgi:hypothetical protein
VLPFLMLLVHYPSSTTTQSAAASASSSSPIDPDWLLSSTVQSAAVLVAIVGGFLVSQLVGLSAQRGALIQRRHHRNEIRNIKQDQYSDIHSERLSVSIKSFVDYHKDSLLSARGEIETKALLEEFIPIGSSDQEMQPIAAKLIESVKKAYAEILRVYPRDTPLPETAAGLRDAGVAMSPGSEEIFMDVANHVARSTESGRRQAWMLESLATMSASNSDIMYERQDARIAKETSLQNEMRVLDKEIALIDEQLSEIGKPEGVKGSIIVLVYLILAGIALPTILMALRPVPDNASVRVAVVAAFISGLIVLVAYLMIRLRSLRPPLVKTTGGL